MFLSTYFLIWTVEVCQKIFLDFQEEPHNKLGGRGYQLTWKAELSEYLNVKIFQQPKSVKFYTFSSNWDLPLSYHATAGIIVYNMLRDPRSYDLKV